MIKHDILLTLSLKFSLLFLLWFFCIKPIERHPIDTQSHFMSTQTLTQEENPVAKLGEVTPLEKHESIIEVDYDSRT